MTNSIAAVILAAGLSRRMGNPKMLLPWGKTTVLGQVITTFSQAGVMPGQIVIVTGGAREAVEAEAQRLAREFAPLCVHNPQYETGEMLSSLQCGLAALDDHVEAALVGLGDQPQLSLDSVLKVIAAYQQTGARLVVPSYNLRRGHPWLVHRDFWGQIMSLDQSLTLRDFLNARANDIMYINTDSTILKDLDTPEEYQRERP